MTGTATNGRGRLSASVGGAAALALGAWGGVVAHGAALGWPAYVGVVVGVGFAGAWCLRARDRSRARRALSLGAVLAGVLLGELVCFGLAGLSARPDVAAFSADRVGFDLDRGFRWQPGSYRSLRVGPAGLSYDVRFPINAQGWWSERDYTSAPAIAVFGDSFTAASYASRSWPDALAKLRPAGAPPVHSYAQDGVGLANWHRVFLREVAGTAPEALVLACYIDSLHRTPTILQGEGDALRFMRFRRFPEDATEYEQAFRPLMQPIARVLDDGALDALVAGADGGWAAPAARLHLAARCADALRADAEPVGVLFSDVVPAPRTVPPQELAARLGPAWPLLEELVARCREDGIPVLLCAIPGREGALAWSQAPAGSLTVHQEELRSVAEHFELAWFDGYELFRGATPEEVEAGFLVGDAHWTQASADRFAAALHAWMQERAWPPAR